MQRDFRKTIRLASTDNVAVAIEDIRATDPIAPGAIAQVAVPAGHDEIPWWLKHAEHQGISLDNNPSPGTKRAGSRPF